MARYNPRETGIILFFDTYMSMTADEKNECFAIDNNIPYTWLQAYHEIVARTDTSTRLLSQYRHNIKYKARQWLRICKYCNNCFQSAFPRGQSCTACKIKRKNKK